MKHTHKGHCQGCGRIQAVKGASIAKHGYVVKFGTFMGRCPGSGKTPLEFEKTFTEAQIQYCLSEAADADKQAEGLKAGTIRPLQVKTGHRYENSKMVDVMVPWNEASEYKQKAMVERCFYQAEGKARMARAFARDLTTMIANFHGKELIPNVER